MIDYRDTDYDVRDDIVESQARAWRSLSEPGTWWTAAQRVAIGREVRASRTCPLCADRKQALSPNAVNGEHDSPTDLSTATVDAVHRIVTDPGRLTCRIVEAMIDEGLTDAHFVELVSVVCIVTAIDGFARTIGAEAAAFPIPQPGEPSRIRPEHTEDDGYWVPTIPYEVGRQPGIGLYDESSFMPNVGRGLSLVPPEVHTARDLMLAHYMPYTSVISNYEPPGRPIDRMQIELVAARVSAKNNCFY
jgi:hypothetical protein